MYDHDDQRGESQMSAKRAARRARLHGTDNNNANSQTNEHNLASMVDGHNLIPQADVEKIKELLKKIRRTEDEWTVIKDILVSHSLIVTSPTSPDVESCNHMLVDSGALIAFTNADDASSYCRDFVKRNCPSGYFQVGSMPFVTIVETADQEHMNLYIDPPVGRGLFLNYFNGQLKASVVF